jgi:hypothetical protein
MSSSYLIAHLLHMHLLHRTNWKPNVRNAKKCWRKNKSGQNNSNQVYGANQVYLPRHNNNHYYYYDHHHYGIGNGNGTILMITMAATATAIASNSNDNSIILVVVSYISLLLTMIHNNGQWSMIVVGSAACCQRRSPPISPHRTLSPIIVHLLYYCYSDN